MLTNSKKALEVERMEEKLLSFKSELKATLLGCLLWVILIPWLGPIFLVFFVWRSIVHKIAKRYRPDLIPLSRVDHLLVSAPSYTEGSTAYTCQVWKLSGRIDCQALRRHFFQCFLATKEDRTKYENFYCYIISFFGYLFKKKVKSIDLEYHIQEMELPSGTSVEDFIGNWMVTHDIDTKCGLERPVWMIKVINELSGSTVIFKLHHGICDGYTIVHLLGKLSGEHAPYMFREQEPPLLKKMKCLAQFPYAVGKLWIEIYRSGKRGNHLVNNFNRTRNEDEKWLISFCTLDLKTVKKVRRVTRTNFVSVMMSIQAGALKRLLKERRLEGEDSRESEVEETYVGHSLGWPKHPVMTGGGGMGNHLTIGIIKSSLKHTDPLARLLDQNKSFQETKSKGYPVMAYYGLFTILKLQPSFVSRHLINMKLSIVRLETGLSTLLCSSKPHSLLGQNVEHLYLPVVTPSTSPEMKLMTVPASHSGILDISVNASTALFKDQETLDRFTKIYFPEELEELRKRCLNLIE